MHVAHFDALLVQVFRQILGHALGQRGDQCAHTVFSDLAHLIQQIIHLHLDRADLDLWLQQPRWADHLFGENAARLIHLPGSGGRRNKNRLRAHGIPFLKLERSVIHTGRQSEPVFCQGGFAPKVAFVHATNLRHGDMALVGKNNGIVGDEFKQCWRWLAWAAPGQIARVVLDTIAMARGFQHLDIKIAALFQTLSFQQFTLAIELIQAVLQLLLDRNNRLIKRWFWRHIVRVRIDADLFKGPCTLTGQRVKLGDGFQFLPKEGQLPGPVLQVGREDLQCIATHPERAALKRLIIALILLRHQIRHHLALVVFFANLQILGHRRIGLNRADAVDARHRGNDDHIIALQQRSRRRVAHPVDLLVDLALLLDEGIGARHIGLWLIVVIEGDKILNGIIREKAFELSIELRRQRFVGGKDNRGALGLSDDLSHGECFASAGSAQQNLIALALLHTVAQLRNCGGLIPSRRELSVHDKGLAAFQFWALNGITLNHML